MKNQKKSLFIIAILALIGVTSIYISNTYAKYISSAKANGSVTTAKWAVKVNSTDITPAGETTLGAITLTDVASNFVVDGTVAPQSSAYGTFEIDPTGSQVAIGYNFALGTITASAGTVPTGFEVEKVEYCSGTTCDATASTGWTAITKTDGLYSGSIALVSQTAALTANEKVTVKVTVKWTDDETAGATVEDAEDDVNHTATGITAPTLTIPVTATVYQKVS